MEHERECQNSVRERQLFSGDVGFVTWRSSSYFRCKNFCKDLTRALVQSWEQILISQDLKPRMGGGSALDH